ncbi:exosome complex component CSL4 [Malaya genurostris]|uniref:exosome complex component CSL4 n=1 Tax=Malaya genurostris TaxID=325434 RepID=UPI0026F40900|nr:exosome complex component CSL4 [Malaya genurostris]
MVKTMVSESEKWLCFPGQRLCAITENTVGGEGTYEKFGYLHASLSGVVRIRKRHKDNYITVASFGSKTVVPVVGDVVTAKITVINQRLAKCSIICIGKTCLNRPYRGVLRKEDVRATEKDRVEMYKCFRPGDVILARVLPLVELNTYYLTTAENALGVAVAMSTRSSEPIPMVPVGWTEMQCPMTLVKEPRKVAKIVPESAPDYDR